uniref:Uncharacterized protein n=1 Tax=Leersia perrieri TaxID=77586 RepID=A0A0D9VAL9_9ORYZ
MVVGSLVAVLVCSCWHLAVAAVKLPAIFCCDAMLTTVAFLTFPLRLLAALDRLVGEMQRQMERLVWEKSELEEKLSLAIKESKAMEEILDEMEEEHDDAITKITLLETQLKALKLENMRLNEHKGKSEWDKKPAPTSSSSNTRKEADVIAPEVTSSSPEEEKEEFLVRRRKAAAVARRRSMFSLGMSAAVGAVVWTADAPCLPLLAGLFAMVGVSMCAVARSLRRRRDGDDGDGVALLGLNWFLLGVLASPMLPGAARAVFPRVARLAGPAVAWLSATVPVSS